jgi:hypothetical protein
VVEVFPYLHAERAVTRVCPRPEGDRAPAGTKPAYNAAQGGNPVGILRRLPNELNREGAMASA